MIARDALAGHVGDQNEPDSRSGFDEVVQVATNFSG
jgi:hypothetical protein